MFLLSKNIDNNTKDIGKQRLIQKTKNRKQVFLEPDTLCRHTYMHIYFN